MDVDPDWPSRICWPCVAVHGVILALAMTALGFITLDLLGRYLSGT
jgi:hypothetical protein